MGQTPTHLPQAVHFSSSITGRPLGPILMASKLQTRTQSPRPSQARGHAFDPPGETSITARHESTPL